MKITKRNSEHYMWGDQCSGWHLVNSKGLSVIEELMPPKTHETKHYHEQAQQFFRILDGIATFEVENEIITVQKGEGMYIPAKTKHKISNNQTGNLEFLVISQPTSRGDRYEELIKE